jgi:hypothetical protein
MVKQTAHRSQAAERERQRKRLGQDIPFKGMLSNPFL